MILYGGTTYAVYSYVSAHKLPTAPATSDASAPASAPGSGSGPCQCAFDVIAGQYDTVVGSEEWSMGYPLLRKWVLNHASGDVLEISAGTGRNLPHYSMGALRSLTICDLSEPMLQVGQKAYPHSVFSSRLLKSIAPYPPMLRLAGDATAGCAFKPLTASLPLHTPSMVQCAEDKFYDDLRLGEKGVPVRFCLSDAHCMSHDAPPPGTPVVGGKTQQAGVPQVHTLPELRQKRSRQLLQQKQKEEETARSGSKPAATPETRCWEL